MVYQTPLNAPYLVVTDEHLPVSEGKHRRPKTNDTNALVHTTRLVRLNVKPRGWTWAATHVRYTAFSILMQLCTSGCRQFQEGTKYLHYCCLASGGGFGGTLYRNVLNLELMSTWVLCPHKALFGGKDSRNQLNFSHINFMSICNSPLGSFCEPKRLFGHVKERPTSDHLLLHWS